MSDNINKNKQLDEKVLQATEKILQEVLPAEIVILTRPLFLKNRTLTISCSNSLAAQEIGQRQQEIVDKINEKLGKNEIDRVRYLT
ncbi:MAG TPA: DUF721 domain-containing protein [Candidatus Magasanikbacteria bacterium]|jgi:predicted nucleic acid-binding Zn ribbon protein|nr:DUF721 domain-containing protein [Candidatus Magasanikbacteria bacterium]HQF57154.1 DUF721 domain-containing protein [Candidatus Magasanikbacteria bacterium]HQL52518.1 DUF721 domain-containing protein [Candidatus Magasanikbacteria bacterium]